MENATIPAIDDPAELAYLEQRRRALRRQVLVVGVAASLAISLFAWKVAKQITAAWWLEANQFVVLWEANKDNWKLGGSTTVRYAAKYHLLFSSDRPVFGLKFLTDLHRLEELDLSTLVGMHDADLENLGQLTSLRRLNLDRSRHPQWLKEKDEGLTDSTLARVGRLSRLTDLNLGGQKFSDVGLKHLASLDQLRSLDLDGSTVTDAGLEHLKALPNLKSLDLTGTKVTPQGVADFEAARPGVRVVDDFLPIANPSMVPQ